MLDFTNTEIAFKSKSNADLRRAQFLFTLLKYPSVVSCCKTMVNIASALRLPVGWAIKPTIYKHFVGGETLKGCTKLVAQLMRSGIKSTLDYSAEGGETLSDIEHTFNETMRSIDYAKGNDSIAYTVFKPTAMTKNAVLERASAKLTLSTEEIKEYSRFKERILRLCQHAYDNDVRILVDAEDYCYQDAVDEVTEEMMRKFNGKRAIVFTTFQMYRWDRKEHLKRLYDDAVRNNYILGMKFVRGAYMEKERARAAQMGYPDPIYATKDATDENYNYGLRYTISHIDHFELFSGTHNEYSNKLLARLLDEHGISRDDKRVFFAQLYGMSDNISYNLAAEGYNVTKYIPYAPVNTVLPYLIRRAEENTSIAGQTTRELNHINDEIKRRKSVY